MTHGILFVGVAVAVIYPLAMRFALEKAQPFRLKMVELGNLLLDSPSLPESHKETVARMLDDAFEWRMMPFAFRRVPVFGWMRLRGKTLADPFADIKDDGDRLGVVAMTGFFVVSAAAANPVVTVAVIIEFLIVALVLKCTRSIDSGIEGIKAAALRVTARTEAARVSATI